MLPVIVQLRLPYETEGVTTAWKTLGRLNKLMRELHKMAWNFAHLHLIRCSTSAKCGSEKRTCLPKYLADCVGFNIVMSPTLVFILAAQRLPNKPALIKICVFVKKRKLNQKGRHRFWLIFATLWRNFPRVTQKPSIIVKEIKAKNYITFNVITRRMTQKMFPVGYHFSDIFASFWRELV